MPHSVIPYDVAHDPLSGVIENVDALRAYMGDKGMLKNLGFAWNRIVDKEARVAALGHLYDQVVSSPRSSRFRGLRILFETYYTREQLLLLADHDDIVNNAPGVLVTYLELYYDPSRLTFSSNMFAHQFLQSQERPMQGPPASAVHGLDMQAQA